MTKAYKSHRRLLTDAFCASAAPGVFSDTMNGTFTAGDVPALTAEVRRAKEKLG